MSQVRSSSALCRRRMWYIGAKKLPVSSISENSENPKADRRNWPHNFYIFSSHGQKVYSIVTKTHEGGPTNEMDDLSVNAAVWEMFMNTTLQAAVHLGHALIRIYDL